MDVQDRAFGFLETVRDLGRRRDDDAFGCFCQRLRQSAPEFENPQLAPDVLADVFVIIPQQDHLAVDQGEVFGVCSGVIGGCGESERRCRRSIPGSGG